MIKRFFSIILLAASVQAGWSFALLGPTGNGGDSWQTAVIGYAYNLYLDERSQTTPGGPVFLGDIGGPKNIGEEYRRNAGTLYYSCDANFLGYFGSNGVVAVDAAFAVMNNLTNVSSYSSDLSEFPLKSQQFNYRAQSLYLSDLKSLTLHLLVEQMGLAAPERFTWTLAERVQGTPCPDANIYLVLQRNYPLNPSGLNQVQYSSYVNDVLYSYYILENCTGGNPLGFTVPFAADPMAEQDSSVAANSSSGLYILPWSGGLQVGGYFTGLTRDDVAGLRYLLQANNVNFETPATGSLLQSPNPTNVIQNFDYGAFLAAAQTNNPAALATLFPNVVAVNTSNYFTLNCTPNVVSYLTNFPGEAVGTLPHFIIFTNGFTCVPLTNYVYNIANLTAVTNVYKNNAVTYLQTVSLGNQIGAPYTGLPVTNVTMTAIVSTNVPPGDFFIIPAGLCGLNINTNPFILNGPVTATTNLLTTATNASGFLYSQSIVTYFTNHYYLYQPLTCAPAPPGLYQGIENVKFARANFDSLIGQFFQPITNYYKMVVINNSQPTTQTFQRVVTQPDFLLTADNFIAANTFNGSVTRNINFDTANVLPALAGPGVINTPTTFSYNKIGYVFDNGPIASFSSALFLSEVTQYPAFAWASFDGSTNDPIVYPNGTSIRNLEYQILVQVSPTTLPPAAVGVAYSQTFTATGGSFSPPFTWSATGLPSGLTMSAGGTVAGTPTTSGTFDNIVIQLTDSLSRTVQWTYTITIP